MKKRIIEWLIERFCKGYHLHRDPARKDKPLDDPYKRVFGLKSPPPEFSTEGGKNET